MNYDSNIGGGGREDNVILEKMAVLVEGREPLTIDLTQPTDVIKATKYRLKEGEEFKIQLTFRVRFEIVMCLKYTHVTRMKGITSNTDTYMMGSFGPRDLPYQHVTVEDKLPRGRVLRADYHIKSKFHDDDNHVIKEWEWQYDVTEDWD